MVIMRDSVDYERVVRTDWYHNGGEIYLFKDGSKIICSCFSR